MNLNITTNSLGQCKATFQKSDYQTIKLLVLDNAGDKENITACNRILCNQITTTSGNREIGDGFNQSYILCVLVAALLFLDGLLNSTNIDPYPLPPSEIRNQNLIASGNDNIDFGTSGVHCSCFSLRLFLKYYFCHILSLENLSGDGQM
jgi:hypothetical protein